MKWGYLISVFRWHEAKTGGEGKSKTRGANQNPNLEDLGGAPNSVRKQFVETIEDVPTGGNAAKDSMIAKYRSVASS